VKSFNPIPIEEIRAARKRIADAVVRTPLVRLNVDDAPAEIYLKLENLQPIGSFKIRGARNALKSIKKEDLKNGVWTLTSGNHGQGVAWNARELGIECSIITHDKASKTKIEAMERLGAKVKTFPYPRTPAEMNRARDLSSYPEMKGLFIGGVDPAVMAGHGTIGLEILEDLPDVDTVLIPFGSGGTSCAIASAIRALKPDVKIYGCEIETATPLAASFAAGKQVDVESVTPGFVEGIGYARIRPWIWDLASRLLEGAIVVGLRETAIAVRLLAERNHVIAEGAEAVPVAAALSGRAGTGKIACVVSGGNVDSAMLIKILQGEVP